MLGCLAPRRRKGTQHYRFLGALLGNPELGLRQTDPYTVSIYSYDCQIAVPTQHECHLALAPGVEPVHVVSGPIPRASSRGMTLQRPERNKWSDAKESTPKLRRIEHEFVLSRRSCYPRELLRSELYFLNHFYDVGPRIDHEGFAGTCPQLLHEFEQFPGVGDVVEFQV